MTPVRIVRAATAHPPFRVSQQEAAEHVGALAGDGRRAAAIARGTKIDQRAVALPPAELAKLGGIEERNRVYQEVLPGVALEAARGAMACASEVGCLVTSSCTGYSIPGWGVGLLEGLHLPCDVARLPLTEAGCAGGVVAMTHAANFVRAHPGKAALAIGAELCSLSFHAGGDEGNLTSSLIFGDGAGAALLEAGPGPGLEIVDSMSVLIPKTRHALGFDLTGQGFYPVLSRELADLLPPAVERAAAELLRRNELSQDAVGAWLLHPGGARILAGIESRLGVAREATHWSWEAMREWGNTSSAAIFDVLERYLAQPAPPGPVVIAAFGPGVSIELLLAVRQC